MRRSPACRPPSADPWTRAPTRFALALTILEPPAAAPGAASSRPASEAAGREGGPGARASARAGARHGTRDAPDAERWAARGAQPAASTRVIRIRLLIRPLDS